MFSVTTDPASNVSFQGTPAPRSGKSDPSPGNDSFAALVDNGAPADSNNTRADAQTASQRRADDAAATAADGRRSRDADAADRAARKASDDRDATARQRADDAADADADASPRSRVQAGSPKAEPATSTRKQASDRNDQTSATDSAGDSANPAKQDGLAAKTPDPVAVPIATAAASTDAPAVAPAAGNATAPLAIAAAGIASAVAASGQGKIDPDAAAPAATTAAEAGTAKTDAQAAATVSIATSAAQPAIQASTISATDVVLAASVPATGTPKAAAPLKAPAAQTGTAATDDSGTAPGTADPTATATSTGAPASNATAQAAAGRAKAGHGAIDAAKADGSAAAPSASATTAASHAHPELAPAGQAPIDSSDPAMQAAGTIQPHLHSAAAAAAAAGPLTAAAATSDTVPLSGLAVEIVAKARSGNTHFEIRLDPADLGRIDVRIDVDRNGHVTSHLMVEKPETLSMLRQDAPQLQRALDDAGFRTGDSGLQFSLRDQSSSGQNDGSGSGRNAHRLIVSEEDSIPAVVAGRTYGRMLGSSSGVDIRI